ncbi:MAG: orotate phosphoribosyltransferase [Bdellovibrio sp.]|nr:MAG: orotate phosphoribosyltransferase [Bdellovibrio sp.]
MTPTELTATELARQIYAKSYLRGEFRLRSGQISNEYFDKYRFESEPALLCEIARHMAKLIPPKTEILAGLEMGGIPLATALSLATGLPTLFVRKKAKEYGTCRIAEGTEFAGKKVLVIEDVVTTGGQLLLSARDLRGAGAVVEDVLCVILRSKESPWTAESLRLHSLFTMEEIKEAAARSTL